MVCNTQRPTSGVCEPILMGSFLTGMRISEVLGEVQVWLKPEHLRKGCASKGESTQESDWTCNSAYMFV